MTDEIETVPPEFVRVAWPQAYVAAVGRDSSPLAGPLYRLMPEGSNRTPRQAMMDQIEQMAWDGGFTLGEVLGPGRQAPLAHLRFKIWRVLSRNYDMSSPQIGRVFKRDHTSILYGLKRAQELEEQEGN